MLEQSESLKKMSCHQNVDSLWTKINIYMFSKHWKSFDFYFLWRSLVKYCNVWQNFTWDCKIVEVRCLLMEQRGSSLVEVTPSVECVLSEIKLSFYIRDLFPCWRLYWWYFNSLYTVWLRIYQARKKLTGIAAGS